MNINLRNITNNFQDVKLSSLSSWRQASEITPRDRGGPYVVTQEGYDPEDLTMTANEFVLGRAGKWLPIALFYRLPIPERRAEFVFGTAAEVMQVMSNLPSKAAIFRGGDKPDDTVAPPEGDEMAQAIKAGKKSSTG
jgi:hypothetical protein